MRGVESSHASRNMREFARVKLVGYSALVEMCNDSLVGLIVMYMSQPNSKSVTCLKTGQPF